MNKNVILGVFEHVHIGWGTSRFTVVCLENKNN